MATVTGLTAERMLEIEAASVVDGEINDAGHLILIKHDGTEIDAGNALRAIPDASTTQRGIVELATESETAAHTDTDRVVTPASLASTMTRITDLELEPGDRVQILADNFTTESATPSSYPVGISIFNIDSPTPQWSPYEYGLVVTYRQGPYRNTQYFHQDPSTGNNIWVRGYHTNTGWRAWSRLAIASDPASMGFTGEIRMWSGSSAPSGWALCDGSALDRTIFAQLFSIIGTTYGIGNGSTTFNIPDFRGRVAAGFDGGQTEFDVMAKTGGEKTHILTTGEMPSHTHTQNAHNHGFSGTGALTDGPTGSLYQVANGTFYGFRAASTGNTTPTNQNTGGGAAHNNLQPYLTVHYIIKT